MFVFVKEKVNRFLPEYMYGSMDGLITTFSIITGAVGAGLAVNIIIILGAASVVADAFSMASSNYVSQRSICNKEDNYCEPNFPFKTALATFTSFFIAGSISLLPFILGLKIDYFNEYAFHYSLGATFIMFFIIGIVEGKITKQDSLPLGIRTLLIGVVAALVAYGMGQFLSGIV